jgi:hypothetical protein
MPRASLIFFMVASVAAADSSTPAPKTKKCADDVALLAAEKQLELDEKRAIDAELAKLGAKRIELQSDLFSNQGGGPRELVRPTVLPAWKVATDDKGRQVVAEPSYVRDCGPEAAPQPAIFVRAADGTVRRLVIGKRTVRTRKMLICGCPFEAMNRCGAAMEWTEQRRWILPPGERYSGDLKISIGVEEIVRSFTKGGFQECPPVPQPP